MAKVKHVNESKLAGTVQHLASDRLQGLCDKAYATAERLGVSAGKPFGEAPMVHNVNLKDFIVWLDNLTDCEEHKHCRGVLGRLLASLAQRGISPTLD